MSWTFVSKAGAAVDSGTSAAVTVPLTNVHSGDLIVYMMSFEGATATLSVSDGTTTQTVWGPGSTAGSRGTEPWLACTYLLAAVATGSVNYVGTLSGNRAFKQAVAMCYTPSAAASLDGTAVAASGGTSPISSGNITTTGSDGVAFGLYAEFGQATTSETINGVAEDQLQLANSAAGRHSAMWSKTYAAGFTGAAAGTIGSSELYTLGVIAFKIGAGASTTRGSPFNAGNAFNGGRTFSGIIRRNTTIFLPSRKLVIARKLPKAA